MADDVDARRGRVVGAVDGAQPVEEREALGAARGDGIVPATRRDRPRLVRHARQPSETLPRMRVSAGQEAASSAAAGLCSTVWAATTASPATPTIHAHTVWSVRSSAKATA